MIIIADSQVDPLFYDEEKHRKLLLLHVLFLVDVYGDYCCATGYLLFLAYPVIYSYIS